MSLLNSLFAGVSGLRNHQTMLDVIGNNIANVNTVGFKGSRVTFSDSFNQFVRYGTNPSGDAGGTNAYQVGLGMKISSIDRLWNQGTFERTGVTTDLALQGNALYILKNNGETYYSRAGSFVFDADGKLVSSYNGAKVQGKIATTEGIIPPGNNLQDIKIDPNLRLPAVSTTSINWGGNLNSNATVTRTEKYVQSGNINSSMNVNDTIVESNTIYDPDGNEYTFKTTYKKTAANTYDMTYSLIDKTSGNTVLTSPAPTVMVYDGTTGALVTMNGQAPAEIQIQNTASGIDFNFDPRTVTQKNAAKSISSTVDNNRQPTMVKGTLTVYDSLGNAHTLTLKFTKTENNKWNFTSTIPSSSGTLSANTGKVEFNADGSINTINPNPPIISFTPSGGASPQSIKLDFGSGFSGVTQTSSNSVLSALSQNGSASASLSNLNIDQYGFIVGVFSNGTSRKLAQIMLATFPNTSALASKGDSEFAISANSGSAFVGAAGEETGTTIQSGMLEQSNIDLSEEFTKMIMSQRGFQANARIITISDELLQEVTNLVR